MQQALSLELDLKRLLVKQSWPCSGQVARVVIKEMGLLYNGFEKIARYCQSPHQVQLLLHGFSYNTKNTMQSAMAALQSKEAHCLEAAFVAAAILESRGYPPLVMSLESQDNLDHVVYVFKESTGWGAIGKSRELGLQGRAPVFRTVRDLAWSYFDPYVDDTGRLTSYAVANLDHSLSDWRLSHRNVWKCERFLIELRHYNLKASEARYLRAFQTYETTGHQPEPYWWSSPAR